MSRLFEKAVVDYHLALNAESNISQDELYADAACYHLQQAHEKALKFLLELSGVEYPKTHVIGKLLQELEAIEVDYPAELDTTADMLTAWEATSRYSDNFAVTQRQMQLAKNSFCALQRFILSHLDENNSAPDDSTIQPETDVFF